MPNNKTDKRSLENFYTVEDFEGVPGSWTQLKRGDSEVACEIANALLREFINAQPVVYGKEFMPGDGGQEWDALNYKDAKNTHTARLVEIKEVGK